MLTLPEYLVIAYHWRYFEEIIEEGSTGIGCAPDVNALAEAMLNFVKLDDSDHMSIKRNCIAHAEMYSSARVFGQMKKQLMKRVLIRVMRDMTKLIHWPVDRLAPKGGPSGYLFGLKHGLEQNGVHDFEFLPPVGKSIESNRTLQRVIPRRIKD